MTYGYYSENLSAERLELCYELAPPRVKRYLAAEIEHVVSLIPRGAVVLELGYGYGRVLERIATGSSRRTPTGSGSTALIGFGFNQHMGSSGRSTRLQRKTAQSFAGTASRQQP